MPLNLKRRLTLTETAAISACAAVLALPGYFGYRWVEPRIIEARARALLPRLCTGIREQRAVLVSAIEAYKAGFGTYPPDHVVSRQPLVVDLVNDALAYELAGVVYDSTNRMFQLGPSEPAEAAYVTNFFHSLGFRNSAQSPGELKHFLPADKLPVRLLHDDPDVFALG